MAFVKRKRTTKNPPIDGDIGVVEPITDVIPISSAPDEIVPEEDYQGGIITDSPEDPRAIPKPKGVALTFPEIMDYLGSLTPEHWKHCMVYVYRLYPIIDRKMADPNATTNIDKLSGPISTSEFVKRHGGGKYKILVNDIDYGRDKAKRSVCRSVFEIPWTNFLPVVKYEEVVTYDERNKVYLNYLINKGILNGDYTVNDGNKTNVTDMIGFMTKMLDRMDNSNRQVIETIRQSANNGNVEAINIVRLMSEERDKREQLMLQMMEGGGMKDFDKMLSLLEKLKPAETNLNGQISVMEKLIAMQEANHRTQMDLVMKLMEKKETEGEKEPPKSLRDQIMELKELGDVLGMNGGGGKRSTLEIILDKGTEILQQIVPGVTNLLLAKYAGGGMPMSSMPTSTTTTAHQQIQQPNEPVVMTKENIEQAANAFINQFGVRIIGMLDNGVTGDEAADMLKNLAGIDAYAQIVSIGKDAVISAAKAHQAFWMRATMNGQREEEVIQFINDFFEPPEIDGEEIQ